MSDRKRRWKYLLEYTVLFTAVSLIVFLPFLLSGKSLVGKGDGQSQYILQLEYMGRYLREWFSGILKGDFIPRRYDFTIGMGDDISSVVRFHPLDFLSVFVPSAHTEALYHVLIFLRLYLAGIAFSAFISAFHRGFGKEGSRCRISQWGVLAGCMVYLFNGYTFSLGIVHPIYLSPLITFPLLLYGAERIMNRPKLKRTEPAISVAQWTPAISLPITMNAENAAAKAFAHFLRDVLDTLRPVWNCRVGMTLNTSSVVEDGYDASRNPLIRIGL